MDLWIDSQERSLDVNVAVEVPLIPLVNQVGRMVLNDITQFMQQKTGIKNQTHTVSWIILQSAITAAPDDR